MNNRYLLFILLLSIECVATNLDKYFDTSFLAQYDKVHSALIKEGFEEIFFKTPDNFTINALFLERPHARSTVILCAGWFPGRKEGMATFYALLPDDANILLFDARGHAKSEGTHFWTIWRYGLNEYKDVIGAINFVHNRTHKPIIIYGLCSGAFHAAHALIALTKKNLIQQLNIKGCIFDSGWPSVTIASKTAIFRDIEIKLLKSIARLYNIKPYHHARSTVLYKLCTNLAYGIFSSIHWLLFKPALAWYEPKTSLFDKIGTIKTPLFFIHSEDDTYVKIADVKKLASSSSTNHTHWWIKEPSRHAYHHLKHQQAYQKFLTQFINKILP